MGGDVALSLVAHHGDQIGAIIAMAASFGGPDAPQPVGGLEAALGALETVFNSKYAFINPGPATNTATYAMATLIPAETNGTDGEAADPNKLFFPQGTLDLAYCNLYNDFFSLIYAVGFASGIEGTGYAVPDIIPRYLAIIPTPESLAEQKNALLEYHSNVSEVEALLPTISNQIMFISGIQDNIIPIITQLKAVELTPGAWLMQVPDGGHGLPFFEPTTIAETAVNFLNQAQALGPVPKSYYTTGPSSGAVPVSGKVMGATVAVLALLFL